MISPTEAKARPTRKANGSARMTRGEAASPKTATTARMVAPESQALLAAHTTSPATMSSMTSGAYRIASQVFCPCMREKPENIDSNEAVIIVAVHSCPAAKKEMYDMPSTAGMKAPRPYPRPNSMMRGSARLVSTDAARSFRHTRKFLRHTEIQRIGFASIPEVAAGELEEHVFKARLAVQVGKVFFAR